MAERQSAYRKSQLFLHSVLPVENTHNELVKKKLKRGKFLFTKTSLIKIIGIIVLLAGISLFLAKPECTGVPYWYSKLYPAAISVHVIVAIVLYAVFSLGLTINNPGFWVKLDICCNIVLSISTITSSVLTNIECSAANSLHRVPGPLGIIGGVILIISCGGILLLYRYREDDDIETPPVSPHRVEDKPRKSVLV